MKPVKFPRCGVKMRGSGGAMSRLACCGVAAPSAWRRPRFAATGAPERSRSSPVGPCPSRTANDAARLMTTGSGSLSTPWC